MASRRHRGRRGIAPLNLNLGYISSHILAHYKPPVQEAKGRIHDHAGCPPCTDGGEKVNVTDDSKENPASSKLKSLERNPSGELNP
jgi:hypothetical protein